MVEKRAQTTLFGVAAIVTEVAADATPSPSTDAPPGAVLVPGQEGIFGVRATRAEALASLAARARECRRCGLRDGCRGVVFGEGDPDSGIIFLGEAPGAVEDELGRPFVGQAGQLLDRILLAVGFRREEVYISNTALCRPPGNRPPLPEESAACRPWLEERLAVLQPAIVVCLGASAGRNLLGPEFGITRDRGRWYSFGQAKLMATFHPAALLRDPAKKRPVWEDMKTIRTEWTRLRSEPGVALPGGRLVHPGN
jgi:uracil-DNA glycosylase family 4